MIIHKPVMIQEVLDVIPENSALVVDGTLGHGWHMLALLEWGVNSEEWRVERRVWSIVGIDMDEKMLTKAKERLQKYEKNIQFVHGSYKDIDIILDGKQADFILLDIGVNLEHFKVGERWFSIKQNAELDMRFDQKQKNSAYSLINMYSAQKLECVFIDYAEFSSPKAQELAKKICTERKKVPIKTTGELKIILKTCGLGEKACAVIFQSIRIEVNQELENLKIFLEKLSSVLVPGGRCAIMSYHSLEDRIVKNTFKWLAAFWSFVLYNKKVIKPHWQEVEKNRASRSAKLRIIEKLKD